MLKWYVVVTEFPKRKARTKPASLKICKKLLKQLKKEYPDYPSKIVPGMTK